MRIGDIELPPPTKVVQGCFYPLEAQDFQTPEDTDKIISLMYQYPERDFYLHLKQGDNIRELLNRLENEGILSNTTESYYYKNPDYNRSYQRIPPHAQHKATKEWQKNPMYFRITLTLSEWKKREMEIAQKIIMEKQADSNPLILQPNIAGFGIDLIKLWDVIKKVLKKTRILLLVILLLYIIYILIMRRF